MFPVSAGDDAKTQTTWKFIDTEKTFNTFIHLTLSSKVNVQMTWNPRHVDQGETFENKCLKSITRLQVSLVTYSGTNDNLENDREKEHLMFLHVITVESCCFWGLWNLFHYLFRFVLMITELWGLSLWTQMFCDFAPFCKLNKICRFNDFSVYSQCALIRRWSWEKRRENKVNRIGTRRQTALIPAWWRFG